MHAMSQENGKELKRQRSDELSLLEAGPFRDLEEILCFLADANDRWQTVNIII